MKKKIASILMALCSTFAITGLASCDLQEVLPDSGNIGNGSYTMELVDNGFNPLVAYGEAIDCTNLTLHYKQILNNKVIWDTTIPVSSQMFVSGGDTSTVGEKELVIAYETYQFTIDYEVKYRVEYSALDGVFDTQYVYDASEIVKKEAPVYEGYTFQYWKTEIPEVLTGNLAIDAQYYKDDLTAPTVETIVKTYAPNMTLGDFTLPSNEAGKWEFVDDLSTAITSVGSYDYAIRYVPATPEQPSVEDRTVRIVINQKEITVTAGEGNFVYNGNQQIPTYTFSESGLPIQRTIVAEGSATPLNEVPTNAGTYKVTFTLNNANYTLTNNVFTYEIARKQVAILSDVGTYVYNGQGQVPDYSVSEEGVNVVRNIYVEGTTTPLTEIPVNAGKYTITYTLNDANYELLVAAEDCAYEIAPKEVTLKIGKKDFEYNGEKQFPTWTPSEEGLPIVKNVYVKGSNEPLTEDPMNAGTYTYVFTLDDPNYLLVNTQGEYVITPKSAYIEYEITDFDYNGKHQFPTFTPSDPNMEVVTTILLNNQTAVTECINVGTYYYTLSVTDPNYECEPVEESFTIYPKQVEITVSGTELTYNGQEQFPNVSAPEGVELVGILPQKNAGTYTYAISPKSANYAGSAEGKFTIAQKQITFTVAEGTTSFVYDGEAHKPTITMEGAVEGEIVNVLESVEAKTGVGEYNYSITVMDGNYVGSIKGSFEIKALQLRITMDDKNMVYGNKVPEFTYTIEETLDGVTYTAYTGNTDILNITPNSYDVPNVGSYPITVTLGNENVEADIIEGTLTVYTGQSDPALPKLSSDEEYTAPMFGDKLGDVTFSVGLGTWAWDNPDQIIDKMEGFTATATFTSQNPNLAPTTKEFTLKYVQKRQLNFVVEESGRVYTYDGEPHSIVYTITDSKIEGKVYEDISVVGEVTQTNAGEYRTTLQIVSDCYVGSQLVDLVIKKATPTPTFTTLDNVKWSAALRLSDISLPENFAWKADMDLDDVKTYECLAVYTHPEGTQNYEQVEGLFTFDVVRAENALNGVKEEYNFTFADKVFTLSGITATSGTTVLYQYTKDGESVDSLKDAGTYDVLVYVEQSDYYVYAETTTTVHIAKAKNNDTVNTTQNKTYGDMISSLALPTESSAIGTWSWKDAEGNSIENPTTTPVGNAGTVTLTAVFTPHTDHVKNYESREVTVTVNVGRKTIGEPTVGNLELTYTGEAQTVSVTPAEGTEGLYEVSGNVQTNAGTDYVIQLTLKEEHKDNYKWWTNQTDQTIAFKKFNIAKATNVVTVTQENWTYGQETTPAPEIEATFDADSKNFTFLYSSDGTNYDEQKPKNAGTYWIKAKIKVINSNYNTEESQPVEFEIYKADPTDANFTTQYTVTWQEGLTLSGISLPSGYAWKTPTTALVPGQDEYEATYTKSNNYNAKDGKFTVIVNKIETVISVNANRTFAYEESAFDTTNPTALQNWLGVSVNHTEGLNATYAFTYSGEMNPAPTTEIKYVGTYTLTITVAETAHYAEATKEVVITVNKKTNTQSINITTSYNKYLTLADLNDQLASYNEAGKGTWEWKDSTNSVGEVTAVNTPRTFEVIFTPTDSVNYASREAIAYLTVNKATPTLSVSITGWDYLQYNGSVNSPVPNYGTIQNTDGVTVRYVYKQGNTELTLDEMKNAEVGTYTVTAILDASDNFTYKASEPFTFYITQQKVAVPEIKNATYTGAPLDVVVKDAYVNDVGLYTLAPETKTEAGTHDITVTLKNTKNYAWTDGTTESKTVTFTIEKAEVTATISLTDTMGDALTYTTNTKQVAVAFTSNSNATTPTYTTTVNDVVNGTILNAGFYAVTISLNDTDNYVLVAGGSKNFTIQQATNTWKVTPDMQDWTYGGTASAEVGEATFGNATLKVLYEGTNYTSYKSSNKPTNAGTYQVTYSVAETTNYSGLSETVEFKIAKADVETFTISISGWVYDPENKNAVAPTYTTSNTDANRVVTYTYAPVDENGTIGVYTAIVPSKVGTYKVRANMGATANFNATTSEPVEFAITQATPTLTVTLQGWTYSPDNANANAPSYETSNKEGATIAYLYTGTTNAGVEYSSAEKPTQAGSYKVTATLGETNNYISAQAEANFTIAKAMYTPNAPQITNEKVTYGDLLSSVILADNNNGYGHWAWVDTTEGLTVGNAGWRTFAIKFVLDNTASYNYNAVPNQTAGFTVEKKTLQITAEGANSENVVTKIYNGSKQSINYTLTDGVKTYENLTVLGNTEYTTVGSYNITLTIYENNYVGQASFTLKIDKANLTDAEKTIETKEAIYEDTLGMYALPTTDKGTWSWVDGNDTLVGGVGTKTFQAKFTGNGNYNDIEDVDVTFTVAPKTLYFEAQATQTYVYVAGQTYSLSYTLKDEAGKVYSSLNVIRDTKEQAGTYTNLSLALSETNYKAETLTGLTLIIKQADYTVTLPTDLRAIYDTLLKNVTLPTTEEGTWKWNEHETTTVGNVGNNTFSATFTPADINYASANYRLTVQVTKASVVIPSKPDSKTYTGNTLTANIVQHNLYSVFMNEGGTNVGKYSITYKLKTEFTVNYQWAELTDEQVKAGITVSGAYVTLPFEITKATPVINTNNWVNWTGWTYGQTSNMPNVTTNFGEIVYTYAPVVDSVVGEYTTTVPTEVGKYSVKASVSATSNWNVAVDVTKDFAISQATNAITSLTITGWKYGQNANAPTVVATFGGDTAQYTYALVVNNEVVGEYTTTVPTNAGTYRVKATIAETSNYQGAEATQEFEIEAADNTIDKVTLVQNAVYGDLVNEKLALPTSTIGTWTWKNVTDATKFDSVGTHSFYAVFTSNTTNYNDDEVEVTVTVSQKEVELPNVPSKVYTGTALKADLEDTDLYTVTQADNMVNAGNHSITLTLEDATNYKWATTENLSGDNNKTLTLTFTITKAEAKISYVDVGNWSYGDAPKALDITANITVDSNYLDYKYYDEEGKSVSSITNTTPAGMYKVVVKIKASDNYTESVPYNTWIIISQAKVNVPQIGYVTHIVNTTEAQTADVPSSTLYSVIENEGGTEIGRYYVVLKLNDYSNYKWNIPDGYDREMNEEVVIELNRVTISYEIVPTQNTWVDAPTLNGVTWTQNGTNTTEWTFGDVVTVNTPKAEYPKATEDVNSGNYNLRITYIGREGTQYAESTDMPTNVGKYTATFFVPAKAGEWSALTSKIDFEIKTQDVTPVLHLDGSATNSVTYKNGDFAVSTIISGKNANGANYTLKENVDYKLTVTKNNAGAVANVVGNYLVIVTLLNTNYNLTEDDFSFAILQDTPTLSIKTENWTGWNFNAFVAPPYTTSNTDNLDGKVTYTYSTEENGTYTEDIPTNVGTYYVKVTIAETTNYETKTSDPVEFKIRPINNTIDQVITARTATYKDLISDYKITATASTIGTWKWQYKDANGEYHDVTDETTVGDAGTQTFYAVFICDTNDSGTKNYNDYKDDTAIAVTFTVDKFMLYVPELITKTYTGSGLEAEVKPFENASEHNPDPSLYGVEEGTWTNAGTHKVSLKLQDPNNYKWNTSVEATVQVDFVIEKQGLSKPSIQEKTYTGEALTAEVIEGTTNTDLYEIMQEGWINAGTHQVTLTLTEEAYKNFEWKDSTTKELKVDFVVNKATTEDTISWSEGGWIYHTTDSITTPEATWSLKPTIADLIEQGTFAYIYTDTNGVGVTINNELAHGTYTVTLTIADTNNYYGTTTSKTFTVTQATVTVKLADNSLPYNGDDQSVVPVLTTNNGRTLTLGTDYTITGNTAQTVSNEYVATLTLTNANYVWALAEGASGSISINRNIASLNYAITQVANGWKTNKEPSHTTTWVYGATPIVYKGESTFGGTPSVAYYNYDANAEHNLGDLATHLDTNGIPTYVGKYVAVFTTATDGTNYTSDSEYIVFEITQRGVDKTQIKFTSEEAAYTGAVHTVNLELPTLIEGNSFSITFESITEDYKTNSENVGQYTLKVNLPISENYKWSDGTTDPFTLTYTIKAYEVDKAGLSLIATNGNTAYTGSAHAVTLTHPNIILIGDDSFVITPTDFTKTENGYQTNGVTVGDYKLTVALPNGNYTWTDDTTDGYVLTYSITMGANVWKNDPTLTGVNGDGTSEKPYTWTYGQKIEFSAEALFGYHVIYYKVDGTNLGNTQPTDVCTYYAEFILDETANYTGVDTKTIYFNITPAKLTVSFENTEFIYDGTAQMPTVSVSSTSWTTEADEENNYAIASTAGVFTWKITGNTTNGESINAGSYTITVELKGDKSGNYEWQEDEVLTQEYTIIAKEVTPEFSTETSGLLNSSVSFDENTTHAIAETIQGVDKDGQLTQGTDKDYTIVILCDEKEVDSIGNAGEYKIVYTMLNTNYEFAPQTNVATFSVLANSSERNATHTLEFKIHPKLLDAPVITADNNKVYDGTAKFTAPTAPEKGYSVTTTTNFTNNQAINVGEYTVTLTLSTQQHNSSEHNFRNYAWNVNEIDSMWTKDTNETLTDGTGKTYTYATLTYDYEITPYEVSKDDVNLSETKNEYTGSAHTVTLNLPTIVAGESFVIDLTDFTADYKTNNKNVGDYTLMVKLPTNGNYTWADGTTDPFTLTYTIKAYEVDKAGLSLTATNGNTAYTGFAHAVTLTHPNLIGDDSFVITPTPTDFTKTENGYQTTGSDVAGYTLTVALPNANYKWKEDNSQDAIVLTYNITTATNAWTEGEPKFDFEPGTYTGEGTQTEPFTWEYTGTPVEVEATSTFAQAKAKYVNLNTGKDTTTQPTDVGKYYVEFSIDSSDNYTDVDDVTIYFTIKTKKVTAPTFTKYQSNEVVYTGNVCAPTLNNTDDAQYYTVKLNDTLRTEWTVTPVADYILKVTLNNTTNYEWQNVGAEWTNTNGVLTYSYNVTKATYEDTPTTAGNMPYANGATLKSDMSGVEGVYTVVTNNGGTTVGFYDVVLKMDDEFFKNHKWTGTDEQNLTIKFEITIADNGWTTTPSLNGTFANDEDGSPEHPFKWGYQAITPPTIANGVANFGDATYLVEGTSNSGVPYSSTTALPTDAGEYTITFTVDADTNGNYTGLSTIIYFNITRKALPNPTFIDKDWYNIDPNGTYCFGYDGTEVRVTTYEKGVTITGTQSATEKGSYSANFTLDGNHQWETAVNGSSTNIITLKYDITEPQTDVEAPQLTPFDNNQTVYDGTEKYPIDTKKYPINTVINEQYTISISATPKAVGEYTITVTFNENVANGAWKNYADKGWSHQYDGDGKGVLSYVYEITPIVVTVPVLENYTSYNQTSGYTYTYSTEERTIYTKTGDVSIIENDVTIAAGTNAGETVYKVVFKLPNSNYVWSNDTTADITLKYTIEKATVAIPEFTDAVFTYDGTEKVAEVDIVDATLYGVYNNSNKRTNATKTGQPQSVILELKDTTNYEWIDANGVRKGSANWTIGTLTINKANVYLESDTWTSGTRYYANVKNEWWSEEGDSVPYAYTLDEEGGKHPIPVAHTVYTYSITDGTTFTYGTVSYTFRFADNVKDNYTLVDPTGYNYNLSIQIKVVAYDDDAKYYATIENALKVNTATNDVVWVIPDNSGKVIIASNTTIKSGVILKLPYQNETMGGDLRSTGDSTTDQFYNGTAYFLTQHAFDTDRREKNPTNYKKSEVVIAEGVTLENKGILWIGGYLTGGQGNVGFVYGNYAQIALDRGATINSDSGQIICNGYITEVAKNNNSQLILSNGGKIYQPFTVIEHRGGTAFAGLTHVKSINDSVNLYSSAFNRFTLPNITTTTTINAGSEVYAFASMYANEQHNATLVKMIGTSNQFLINLSAGSSLVNKYDVDTHVSKLEIYGDATIHSLSLSLNVLIRDISLDTSGVMFPISWYWDVHFKPATVGGKSTINSNQNIKVLPGGSLTIHEGTTLNVTDLFVTEDRTWTEDGLMGTTSYDGNGTDESKWKAPGQLIVNGTLNVTNINGVIQTTGDTGIVNISGTTNLKSQEVKGRTGNTWTLGILGMGMTIYEPAYHTLGENERARGQMLNPEDNSATEGNFEVGVRYYAKPDNNEGYAWYKATAYQVTFEVDGGSACDPIAVTYGTSYGALPSPTKDGHIFQGWTLVQGDFNTLVESTTMVTQLKGHTLYANWVETDNPIMATFNSDGGTSVDSRQYAPGHVYGYLPAPSKTGYTFVGWTLNGVLISANSIVPDSAIELVASWTENRYYVVFNANGGVGSMLSQELIYTQESELTENAFERYGYHFIGWATAPNGAKVYDDKEKVKDLTTEANGYYTLYALWEGNTYTVEFQDSEGSHSEPNKEVIFGNVYTVPTLADRDGFKFDGWFADVDGDGNPETKIEDGATVNIANDIILYARWTPVYIVTFDANGGTCTAESMSIVQGATLNKERLPTEAQTTKFGYTLIGWSTTKNGELITEDLEIKEDTTLYARWEEKVKCTVTIKLNLGTKKGMFTTYSYSLSGGTIAYRSTDGIEQTINYNKITDGMTITVYVGEEIKFNSLEKTAALIYTENVKVSTGSPYKPTGNATVTLS